MFFYAIQLAYTISRKFHCDVVFPSGKLGREIWGFEVSRFLGNLCWDHRNFFSIIRVSVVLISAIPTQKCVHVKFKKFFLLVKNYFSEFPELFTTKCAGDQECFL